MWTDSFLYWIILAKQRLPMRQAHTLIEIATRGQGLVEISAPVG